MKRRLFALFRRRPPAPPPLLPAVNDETAYRRALKDTLNAATAPALKQLNTAERLIPRKAQSLIFMIHLSQEGDGSFDIRLHLAGPDLHSLNRAIAPHAALFEGRAFSWQSSPANVPAFDPADLPFDISTAIAETARDWLETLWTRAHLPDVGLPAQIASDDGWTGALFSPVQLSSKQSPK